MRVTRTAALAVAGLMAAAGLAACGSSGKATPGANAHKGHHGQKARLRHHHHHRGGQHGKGTTPSAS